MTGNFIKAFENVIRILLIVIAISTALHRDVAVVQSFDAIVLAGFLLYGLSALLKHYVGESERTLKTVMPFFALVIVFATTAILFNLTFEVYKLAVFIGFMAIWISGAEYDMRTDRITPVRNRFLICVLVLTLMFFVLFVGRFDAAFDPITRQYFPIYVLIGLLYLNLVNMRSAYELNMANAINKDVNVRRFSGLATIVAIGLILTVRTRIFGLGNVIMAFLAMLQSVLIRLVEWIVYPLAYGMAYLITFIRGMSGEGQDLESGLGVMGRGERLVDFGVFVEEHQIPKALEDILTVIAWIAVVAVTVLMVVGLYKKIGVARLMHKTTGIEERNFVFDELKWLGTAKEKGRSENEEQISGIRLDYRNALVTHKKNGMEKKAHTTPDEFLKVLNDQACLDEAFVTLTEAYKTIRYGGQK